MRRIAFLRSIEVQQTDPYLAGLGPRLLAEGIEAKLFYTDGTCAPGDFPGDAEKLPAGVSVAEVVDRLLAWGAEGAVSISIPDENALRDAIVRQRLAERGIPMVMHEVEPTRWFSNKWDTKEVVRTFGLATPPGMFVDGDLLNGRNLSVPAYRDYLLGKAREIGYPLLSKPLWDCLANGVSFLEDEAALVRYLDQPYSGNTVLERCVTGELCSVEVLVHDGVLLMQPLLWKGRTGGDPGFLFGELRYCAPRPEADEHFAGTAGRLREMCRVLGLDGSVEIEMIYAEGGYQVIEINPRVSGTTTMSIAATARNSYECLLDMLLGNWSEDYVRAGARAPRLAFQFPVHGPTDALAARLRTDLDVVRVATFHIDGEEYANVVISCEYADAPALAGRLEAHRRACGFVEPSVVTRIADVVRRALPGADRQSAMSASATIDSIRPRTSSSPVAELRRP